MNTCGHRAARPGLMVVVVALVGWGWPAWAGPAKAKPAPKPAKASTTQPGTPSSGSGNQAATKPAVKVPSADRPVSRPAKVSAKDLAETLRRARASTQRRPQPTAAAPKAKPNPSAAAPKPKPVAAAPRPTPKPTPAAGSGKKNRFANRFRQLREKSKRETAGQVPPKPQAKGAKPSPPSAKPTAPPAAQPAPTSMPKPPPKLPAEQRKYMLSFYKADWDMILDQFCRWSDLTIMGQYPRSPVGGITYINPRSMTYHEALHELNMLLMEENYWLVREKNHLRLRRLSDWFKYLPAGNRFESREEFEKAQLDDDDLAMVFHAPEGQAVAMITDILVLLPDNVLRVTPVGDTTRLKITGICYYIRQFLELADSEMFREDQVKGVKLRKIKFYKIERGQAASVHNVLQRIVAPPQRRRIGVTAEDAAQVDMVVDQMTNTIIVKANDERHNEIKEMIDQIEASDPVADAKCHFIKLKQARAEEVATILNPLLQQQAAMEPSFDARRKQRQKVFLQADPSTNSLIVLATKEGLERVEELLKQFDVATPEAKYKRIALENARADQIYPMVNNIVQARQAGRRRGPTPGRRLQVFSDPQGDALFVIGDPKDMEYVEKLVSELDAADTDRTKAHIVKLKKANPTIVSQGLQALFGGQGGRVSRRSPAGSFRVLPDVQSRLLVVICTEKDWKEIEPQIKEFDEQAVSLDPVMRALAIKNGDVEEIAQTLNNALGGKVGRAPVRITADRQSNRLFVTTLEPAFEEIESLVRQLDVPTTEGKLEVIPLANASATEVATLISQMFVAQGGRRRFAAATGPQIIPDPISNALIVRASKTDLAEIELQAMRLDDAAKADGNKPTIIQLEYADPSQVSSLCQAMFVRRTGRRSADQQTFFYPTRTGLVVRAPAQQMAEIKAFVKSLDSPETENIEVKTVQLPGQDVEQVALTLSRVFSGERRRRDGGAMSFMPHPSADMLVITAPKKRFEEIDKYIKQYSEGVKVAAATMKMFELKNARADDVAELLTQMLDVRSRRGRRSSAARQVEILRDPRQNKLIVFAPDDVMKQADDMIQQLDVPLGEDAGGVQWLALEYIDASYVASTLQEMWSQKQRRGRSSFRTLPVQIWPETITNSVLVSAPADEFKEIEALAKKLDAEAKVATTQPTIIPLEYANPEYVARMCEEMFIPQMVSGRGRRSRPRAESVSFTPTQSGIMVRASQTRMKPIEEFIKSLDVPEQTRLAIKTYHLPGLNVEQLYQTLQAVFGKIPRKRDEPAMSFQLDAPRETIIVAADNARFTDIDKVIEDFKKSTTQDPSIQEMVPVKHARASYVASILDDMLRKQLAQRSKRLAQQLQISVEERQNKVIIYAPKDVLALAKKLLGEIDIPVEPLSTQPTGSDMALVKWIAMEHVDASSAASTVNQIWEASLPPQRATENRPPVRIWGEPITNSILVAHAYGKDYQEVERIAKDIDAKAVQNPNKPLMIKLEYASPSEVASMISALFIPPGRRAQQKVMVQTVSGGIVVRAPKVELKEIEEFVKSYDAPEATGLKMQTFHVPQTNVSELASTLNTIFGAKKKRRNEPGWNFIPNTDAEMLMVLAPETRMKEIEEVVKEYQENQQKTASKMRMFDIQYTRANYVVTVLNELLREKLRRTRGRRAVQQLQISYESRQNKVVVFAPDDVMKQVEEMIKQIDVELTDDEEQIQWIEIVNADASEVASTLNNFFSEKKSYRRRQDSAGIRQVRIWPEMVTNSVLVSAPKKEYDEIEKLAKKIDEEHAEKGKERVKITPKFVSVGQIQNMIQQLFTSRSRRRDVRSQRQQIRVIPAGQYSLFLEAPKDKLAEVTKMIEEMDVEGENAPIIKTYKMGDADVRQLARALSQTTGGIGSFIPEPRRGALIVSAPKHQFDRIEKAMEQLKAEIQEEELQFEVLMLKFARPSDVSSRLNQLVNMRMSRRTSRRDRSVELSMMPDDNNNRLFVHAGPEELALVKKMLGELDIENLRKDAELYTIPLRRTDCDYMAGAIGQVFTQDELRRRWKKRGQATRDIIPIRAIPEPMTNTLLVMCAEEDFREIELFVAQLEDAYTEKEKVRELITPKFVSEGQLMSTINAIYSPPARKRGERYKRFSDIRAIPAGGSSFYLEAPKDMMVELKKLIAELDVEDRKQPVVRTYKLKGVDVRQLTRLLSQTMAGKGSFVADPQMGMVIISAPEHRFEQIEKMMNKLQGEVEAARQQFKVLPLKFAKANNIYSQLSSLVSTRLGRRRSGSVQLQITPDPVLNRLFVYAGDEELKLVEEMLTQIDVEGVEPEQQVYSIELINADASYVASMVQQMFSQEELRRRRRGKVGAGTVAPVRVMADTMSNRLLVWASPQDYTDIEKFVKEQDEIAKVSKPERRIIKPEFIRTAELSSMIQTLFLTERRRRSNQRARFIQTTLFQSGADIILNGPKDRLDEIEAFVKSVDTEERAKMEVKTFLLPEVEINSLVSTLNQLFAQDARKQRGNMLFIPDVQNSELMVSAPKSLMKDIEEIIETKQAGAKKRTRKLTMFEIEHTDASYLASMLRPLILERTRSRRGRYVQPEVTITPETRTNRLLIMAADAETKVAEELIAELDTEAMGLKGRVRTIELKKADVEYVASTLQTMFSGRAQLRKSRTFTSTPVYIVAEPMTDRIFVAASEADFKEIEKLAMEMDAAAELQGIQREKIPVQFASPGQLVSTITEMFRPLRSRGRKQQSDVRLNVVGTNIVAQAPASKMVEIKKWITELDVEEFAETQTKFFTLEIARAAEVQGIIQPMLQAKAQEIDLKQGQRKRKGGNLVILPDTRNNRLIITAPSQLIAMAGELIKELDVEDPAWTGETVEIIEIEKAEAQAVAQVLQQILEDREGSRLRRPRKGRTREYTGLAVTIVADASSNTLVLKGLPRELDRVKQLIAQIEEKAVGGGIGFKLYRLIESDAEQVAEVVQQMVNQAGGPRSKRNPIQVTTNWAMNSMFVAGTRQQQAMVQKIIDVYEHPDVDPETGRIIEVPERAPFEFVRLTYSDARDLVWDLESLLEKQFPEGKGPTLETLWDDSTVLMVSGKPDQIKVVKQLVQMFELKNKSKPPVTRTVDITGLDGADLVDRLKQWGVLEAGDKTTLVGKRRREELIREIKVDDALDLRDEAEKAKAEGRELRLRPELRSNRSRDRGVRYVPPSVLGELAAELNGVVCAASATTAPAKAKKTKARAAAAKKQDPKAAAQPAKKRKAKPATAPAKKKAKPVSTPPAKQKAGKVPAKRATVATKPARVADKPEAAAANRFKQRAEDRAGADDGVGDVLGGATGDPNEKPPPVSIIVDDAARTIQIKGSERRVAELEELIYRLQEEVAPPLGKEMEYKVYEPRYIDVGVAAALLDRVFNEPKAPVAPKKAPAKKGEKKEPEKEERMMGMSLRDMMRGQQLLAGAKQRVRVVPDPRTGYLIVVASPETHREIRELLVKVDVPGLPPGDIEYFHLKNLDATEVERGLRAVLKLDTTRARRTPTLPKDANKAMQMLQQQIQQMQAAGGAVAFTSAQITITSAPSTNTLIVMAPDEVMEIIRGHIETLEAEAGGIEIEAVALDTADASQVAKAMSALYGRGAAGVPGKAAVPGAGARVIVTADSSSNTVFVRGPKDLRAEVIERIKKMDAEASEASRPFRIVLEQADAEVLAPKLQAAFATRKKRLKQAVQIVGDNASNTLIVRAPENLREEIEELAKALDVESVDVDIRVFPLEHADAVEVHQQMTQMTMQVLGQLRGRGKRNLKLDVFAAVPDPRTNSLVVTGGAATFAIVEKILLSVDKEPTGKTEQITVVYQLEQAQASDVARAINQLYRSKSGKRYTKGGLLPPSADSDGTTNTVIIRATDRQQKMIKKDFIDKLEEFSKTKKIKDTTIELKHAKSDEVAEILNNYFAQRSQGRRMRRFRVTPADIVSIVSEPNGNVLLVRCNDENLEAIQKLVAQMDREEVAGKSMRKTNVIALEYADPGSAAQAIRQSFVPPGGVRGRISLRERVDAVPVYATGSLVVTASEENMQRVDDVIKQLDVETAAKQEKKQIKLEFAEADEVARQLTQLYSQTRRRTLRGQLPVTVTPDERTNSVIVAAKKTELADVEALIKTLDVPSDQLKRRKLQIFQLEWAEPATLAQMINQAFRSRGGRRGPSERVMAAAEYSTGSLVVSASPDNMQLIEQLVQDVDQEGASTRQMHVVEITNGEAQDIAQALNQMFVQGRRARRSGQPPITIINPQGTNKVMVMASEADFRRINEAIKEMDVGTGAKAVRVVSLANIAPEEAQTILTEFLRKPGRTGRYDPSLLGDVRMTVSESAGALILTARKEKLDELETLIKKIDVEAPEGSAGQRKIEIFPLEYANAYYTAQAISQAFQKRGRVAESDRVVATAEGSTGSVIISASEKNLVKIRKFLEELDREDKRGREVRVVTLTKARAQDVAQTLAQAYRTRRRGARGEEPVAITAEVGTNSLIIAAKKSEHEEVADLIAKLDVDPTANDEIRVIPLEHIDAPDALEIMEDYLRRPGTGRRAGELAGGTRLTASDSMNALVVSGKKENVAQLEKVIAKLDQPAALADRLPKIIPLEAAQATMLASMLEQMFTEPAQKRARGRRGGAAEQMVPLIMADEGTNSLIVLARKSDFNVIEQMAKKLDREDIGVGLKTIPVPPTMNVVELAGQVERLINESERNRAQKTGRRASQVAVEFDPRTNCLILAGAPELFAQAERLIKDLQAIKPAGQPTMRIIPLKNLNADDIKQVLDQMMEQEGGRRRGRRYYR